MNNKLTIQDIMIHKVVSVHPETPILEAHKLMSSNNFNGLPVVDNENKLVGIITEYDLLTSHADLLLPTLQKIFSEMNIYGKDKLKFKKELKEINKLTVGEMMNDDPLKLDDATPFEKVVQTFQEHHRVNPIPIVNKENNVVGVVSRFDVLKIFGMLN